MISESFNSIRMWRVQKNIGVRSQQLTTIFNKPFRKIKKHFMSDAGTCPSYGSVNHTPRRCLENRKACRAYFGGDRIRLLGK